MNIINNYGKGCNLSPVDIRDYKITCSSNDNLPTEFSIENLPAVKNQKDVNSCVAHVTSSILEWYDSQLGESNKLSTNFIYGIQKQFCGHEGEGMYLRDACKIVTEYGDMLEVDCSGNDEVPECWSKAENALKCTEAKDKAKFFLISSYYDLKSTNAIKKAIYKYGPVLGAIKWYDNFKPNSQGLLKGEQTGNYGYHAIMIYGWNQDGFLCQNSWGTAWGNKGRFILPWSVPVEEAKALIDASIDIDVADVKMPKTNKVLKILYKIFNEIINFFKK